MANLSLASSEGRTVVAADQTTGHQEPGWSAIAYEARPWSFDERATLSRSARRAHAGPYEAAVPPSISTVSELGIDTRVLALAEEASAAIVRFDAELGDDIAPFSPILLRSESAASSQIERLTASAKAIALAELGDTSKRNAGLIVANTRAMEAAIALADHLDEAAIIEMHRVLLTGSHPDWVGRWRDQQVWINGSDHGPHRASFVPPHHDLVPGAMGDLVAFIARDDLPVLVQAAIAHAQFETLHPFVDGNGRTGRALIHVVLRRRGLAPTFVPPISLVLATWSDDYVNGLMTYRHLSEPESTQRSATAVEWLRMFATATSRACQDAGTYSDDIGELTAIWRSKLGRVRANSSADLLLRVLPGAPIVTVGSASKLIGRSKARTTDAVNALARAGILQQRNVGRHRYRVFEATEVLDLFTGLERVLASQTGDTTSGPPIRRVPQHPGSAEPTGQTRSHPPIPSSASASASASSRPDDSPPANATIRSLRR